MTDSALRQSQLSRHAVHTEDEIASLVRDIRSRGYAFVSKGSLIPGASALSAPVFTASDSLPLVMSIVLPGEDPDESTFNSARAKMLEIAGALSEALGSSNGAHSSSFFAPGNRGSSSNPTEDSD